MKTKKILIIILFLASFLTGIGQLKSNKDLIGKWSASTLKLEFLPDGRVLFAMKGGSIPGARYKADFMKTPALLEIELMQQASKIVYRSTIEFIGDHSLRLTTFNNDPAFAFDKQRSVVLVKVK